MNPSKALNLLLKKVFFINDFHANKLMSGKSVKCSILCMRKIRENAFFKRILPWISPKSVKKKNYCFQLCTAFCTPKRFIIKSLQLYQ